MCMHRSIGMDMHHGYTVVIVGETMGSSGTGSEDECKRERDHTERIHDGKNDGRPDP